MHNEKNHNIKHGGGDVAKYADIIKMSCYAPEDDHKLWIKEPGGNTNQGPEAALTMMHQTLRKEASALLCEGVQDSVLSSIIENYLNLSKFVFSARVEDWDGPAWTQVSSRTGESIVLRADRFHRRELQNPNAKEECMGIKVNIWNRVKTRR
jgi:hypothetical protein